MTFDNGRLFVISLLMLCVLYYTKCEDEYTESDERTHLLKDYFSNEILTYLRLLKLENEQRLRQLSQNNPTNGQQYYLRDYTGSNWPYAAYNYDLDRPQDSYYSPYPGELARWNNAAPSKMKFRNSLGVDQQPKILPPPIVDKGKFQNPMHSFPEFSYDANGILTPPIQPSYPLQFLDNNYRYMQFDNINKAPTISYDQRGDGISSFAPNGYNFPLRQLPSGRRQLNIFQPGQQDEGAYRTTSTISEPSEGSMTPPPILPQPTSGNVAPLFDSIGETVKNPNLRMFNVPNIVQTTANIDPSDSADSANIIQPDIRSLASEQKIPDNYLSGNLGKNNSLLTDGGAMSTNKNYKVLIVDGEEGDNFTFDSVRKKLFWLQGLNPTGATKVMAAAATSGSSEGQPQHTLQTASVSNNEASFMSSPPTKSLINDSAGDGSIVTSVVENQTRDLGVQYKNSSYGRFDRGKNKGHTTITSNKDKSSAANQGTPSAGNQGAWIN